MAPAVVERARAARRKVTHRARDSTSPGSRARDPGADVDGDPPGLAADLLDLAHVDPGPELDAERLGPLLDVKREGDGLERRLERRVQPVAGGVDLVAAEQAEGGASLAQVALEQALPAFVT